MKLRLIQDSDFDFLCQIELDPINNSYTTYNEKLTHEKLRDFILSEHDLTKNGQLRLVMERDNKPVGFFDLYDFNPNSASAGVGIIVHHPLRRSGIGSKAVQAFFSDWFKKLNLNSIYADVEINNLPSRLFFEKNGFKKTGITEQIERYTWHGEER